MRDARITDLPSGGALHVLEPPTTIGASAPRPVLFLHGVGGGAWSWNPQAAALAVTRPCYLFEARGHGRARAVADAGLGDYFVDAQEALIAVVRRRGPAFVAGHSMGGLLALALAAERRTDVAGLLLSDPVYGPGGAGHAGERFASLARAALGPLVRSMQCGGPLARVLGRAIFRGAFVDRAAMERAWRHQRLQVPFEYPRMMFEAFTGPTHFPNRAFAREIDAPVLLVEPAAREFPRSETLVRELERLGDRFTYLALHGGHYLQLDRTAARVTQAFEAFLARW